MGHHREIVRLEDSGLLHAPEDAGRPDLEQLNDLARVLQKLLNTNSVEAMVLTGDPQGWLSQVGAPGIGGACGVYACRVLPGQEAHLAMLRAVLSERGWVIHHQRVIRPSGSKFRLPLFVCVVASHENEVLREALNGEILGLRGDSRLEWVPQETAGSPPGRLRIGLFTLEFGPYPAQGGIGTAFQAMAEALVEAGHHVTVLVFPLSFVGEDYRKLEDYCQARGMDSEVIMKEAKPHSFHSAYYSVSARGRKILEFLRKREQAGEGFDIVHSPDAGNPLSYAMRLKRLNLAFQDTHFVVGLHGPLAWVHQNNQKSPQFVEEMAMLYMEKVAVQLADTVISPSYYLLNWLREEGWCWQGEAFVQQNILTAPAEEKAPASGASDQECITELVFFGRLEFRKGLKFFCDALDELTEDPLMARLRLTFLGPEAELIVGYSRYGPRDYLRDRHDKGNWPWEMEILSAYDSQSARAYLRAGNRLAIMPSTQDNSPYTVLEALLDGIPFIAGRTGGIPELIHPEDVPRVTVPTFDPANQALRYGKLLARAIGERIKSPLEHRARWAIDPERTRQCWVDWHEAFAREKVRRLASPIEKKTSTAQVISEPAFFSVCIPTFNRAKLLKQAVDSVLRQDYSNYEIIVVDDGSTDPDAVEYLQHLEQDFARKDWLVLRQQQGFPSRARNYAAANARGDFLLFMDDDNVAEPNELSVFQAAIHAAAADVYTCGCMYFREYGEPRPADVFARHIPLGSPIHLACLDNVQSDTNCVWRADGFRKIGGFKVLNELGYEDYEIINRASVMGMKVELVPEYLYYYRVFDENGSHTVSALECWRSATEPFFQEMPEKLRDLLPFAYGMMQFTERIAWGAKQSIPEPSSPKLDRQMKKLQESISSLNSKAKKATSNYSTCRGSFVGEAWCRG
ncbi:MAG: glycosyltransferase [Verrucomicrobiales bacterium]